MSDHTTGDREIDKSLLALFQSGLLVLATEVNVYVCHNENCLIWSDGVCNCPAEVQIQMRVPIKKGDEALN